VAGGTSRRRSPRPSLLSTLSCRVETSDALVNAEKGYPSIYSTSVMIRQACREQQAAHVATVSVECNQQKAHLLFGQRGLYFGLPLLGRPAVFSFEVLTMTEAPPRLGDSIDDFCPRCKLLLDHAVASMVDNKVVKVTCRTCFSEHPYREGNVPPKKKSSARAVLVQEVLAKAGPVIPPAAMTTEEMVPVPSKKKRRVAAARYISRHTSGPRGKRG
jgi:hypothetical protein